MSEYIINPLNINRLKRLIYAVFIDLIVAAAITLPVYLRLYEYGNVEIFTIILISAFIVFISMIVQSLSFPTLILKKDEITTETWLSQIRHLSQLKHFPPQAISISRQGGNRGRTIGSDFSLWNIGHTKREDYVLLILPDKLLSEIKKADDLLGTKYVS